MNEKKHPFVESDMMEGDMLKMIRLLAYERGPTNQPINLQFSWKMLSSIITDVYRIYIHNDDLLFME